MPKANTPKCERWRTVRTKRGIALRTPDGNLYYGTAQEVRDAALMPSSRGWLAYRLRSIRKNYSTSKSLCEILKQARRDALAEIGRRGKDEERRILADACASLRGMTYYELVNVLVDSWIAGVIADLPGHELPLTRHERAALDACRQAQRTA